MALKKVLLTKKLNNTVYQIFPKTSADVVTYGDTTVAAALAAFAADMANYYTSTETDAAIKAADDALYNKIMGITEEDGATVKEAYDTLKEVAAWIDAHGEVAAAFTTDIAALKTAVGDAESGLIKGLADAVAAIESNDGDIEALQNAVSTLESVVGDAESGLVMTVTDHGTRIGALETTVGDAESGLVKRVTDLEAVGSTKVEQSATNGNIKINGTETVVYTHPEAHPATMITEDDTHKFVTQTQKDIIDSAAAVKFVASEDSIDNERDLFMVEL